MFSLLSKRRLSALFAFLLLIEMNPSLIASDCCDSSESSTLYIGAFGGAVYSNATKVSQMGTAFFTEAQEGPLAVFAQGRTKKTSAGFGGAQIGYEWSSSPLFNGCSDWNLSTAAELEAYFYCHNKKGHLINPTNRLPEHDFVDSFHMNTSVCLVNAVISVNNSCWCDWSPYFGGGIGGAHISLKNAKSIQVSPEEAGINHFNSETRDTSWAFAAQAKVGLRYKICESLYIFGEYRYMFVDSSNYIFGSTVYPTHAPTSPWNVKVKEIHYNAFSVGIRYDL